MKLTRVGVDFAKNVFQVHGVDRAERSIWNKRLKRNRWIEEIEQYVEPGAEIGMKPAVVLITGPACCCPQRLSSDSRGLKTRWRFTEITANSSHWIGAERASDSDPWITWEHFARRTNS